MPKRNFERVDQRENQAVSDPNQSTVDNQNVKRPRITKQHPTKLNDEWSTQVQVSPYLLYSQFNTQWDYELIKTNNDGTKAYILYYLENRYLLLNYIGLFPCPESTHTENVYERWMEYVQQTSHSYRLFAVTFGIQGNFNTMAIAIADIDGPPELFDTDTAAEFLTYKAEQRWKEDGLPTIEWLVQGDIISKLRNRTLSQRSPSTY